MEEPIIKVHFVNGTVNNVRYNEKTTVQRVIEVLLNQLDGGDDEVKMASGHFSLRLVHKNSEKTTSESIAFQESSWLHRDSLMKNVVQRYAKCPMKEYKCELRVRYLAKNMKEMAQTEPITFQYFYEQIHADYLVQIASKADDSLALELGCVEMRRFLKDMHGSVLDSKSNLNFIEHRIGFQRFFASSFISQTKPKTLRKSIQKHLRKYSNYSETECMFRFLDLLSQIARYDIEIFKASLGTDWSKPLEVVIGPNIGISYVNDRRSGSTKLAQFLHIVDIRTRVSEPRESAPQKTSVYFRLSDFPQPLIVTCPNRNIAESLADLVDGYQMLDTQQASVWSDKDTLESPCAPSNHEYRPRLSTISSVSDDNDYTASLDSDYVLDRRCVTLEELLGEGQFGDVYRGNYEPKPGQLLAVAVKVCKVESEGLQGENFLREAYVMQQFHHPHIISLVGVCFESPIWIAMELAPLGELRTYLLRHNTVLSLPILLLFCHQLSDALSYLFCRHYVHRDVAARNVLVVSENCVKLSDFGLSRHLEHDTYTASKGKLPIKWMAPESINFRNFTAASDIWMFGVCIWEVVMLGEKPWQNVHNRELADRLESGERPLKPTAYRCPPRLYALLMRMWAYREIDRPTIGHVRQVLFQLLADHSSGTSPPHKSTRCIYPAPVATSTLCSSVIPSRESPPSPTPSHANPIFDPIPCQRHVSFRNSCCTTTPITATATDTSTELPEMIIKMLKQQRIQSAEDEKWLEEEAQNLQPNNVPSIDDRCIDKEQQKRLKEETFPVKKPRLSRDSDRIHSTVVQVVQAITEMTRRLSEFDDHQFVQAVKNVTCELKHLLDESGISLCRLTPSSQLEVQMVEKLLESDVQKLTEAMRSILDEHNSEWIGKDEGDKRRRVLECSHELALDCKHFLDTFDAARIISGIATFESDSNE